MQPTSMILVGTFIISFCGLIYELIISTVASYLIGSSVFHFSLTIGLFLFFMGVGSFFSQYITQDIEQKFIRVETFIGLFGGLSSTVLFLGFAYTDFFYVIYVLITAIIGICTGLEIPLATRIIKDQKTLSDALAQVLTFDYIGSLIGAILFPIVLLPYFGLSQTAVLIGGMNLLVATGFLLVFKHKSTAKELLLLLISILILSTTFVYNQPLSTLIENHLYQDEVIYSDQTPYQKIVLTRFKDDLRLYLDGNLQFSTTDEHRYHETLVHTPLSYIKNPEQVLIIGGGDGIAARELLKYSEVDHIQIVDLDPAITELSSTHALITNINNNSLSNSRVEIFNQDGFSYLEDASKLYDLILIDLPDPANYSVGKLYTKEFYRLASKHLSKEGILITQASSPYYAREAFWAIENTLESVFLHTQPLNTNVPSFGHWGFVMARNQAFVNLDIDEEIETLYFNIDTFEKSLFFDNDMSEIDTDISTLQSQSVVEYYQDSFENW